MPTGPQSQGLAKMAAKESCGIATSGGVRVMHGGKQILNRAIRLCGGTLRVKKVPVDA